MFKSPFRGALVGVLALLAGAHAGPALAAPREDPFEKLNRVGFAITAVLAKALFAPVGKLYHALTPGPIGKGLHNAVINLGEPLVAINDLLQARPKRAGQAVVRFAYNSTFGLAGFVDVAKHGGIPHHVNSFGDTLGRYGVKPGPYLFLPVLGPSDARDFLGFLVDQGIDPVHWANYPARTEVSTGAFAVGLLDEQQRSAGDLKALLAESADPYATLRSAYLQSRRNEVDEGRLPDVLPDLGDSPPPGGDQAAPLPALPDHEHRKSDDHVAPTSQQRDGQGEIRRQAEQRTD